MNTSKTLLLVFRKRHQYNRLTGATRLSRQFQMEAAMSSDTTPAPRIFYGWLVVAAAFAVTFVGFGSAYTFSAFVESLQRDFGGSVSLVFSLAGFLYFGLGSPAARSPIVSVPVALRSPA
jgi:hypothetical protein